MRSKGRSEAGEPVLWRAALPYARRGVPVFPFRTLGKAPLTPNGHLDATREERPVRAWWGRWPFANVGVPTGEKSGLLVLDVDPEDGEIESLKDLFGKYHADHMIPLSRGGLHDWTNIAIACPFYNCSKKSKTAEEFMES
jgi:hypothetical protein